MKTDSQKAWGDLEKGIRGSKSYWESKGEEFG
jgi:hypothetical protein